MSVARQSSLGAVRTCPHCKATVLASASVCPSCQHHLRFNAAAAQAQPAGRSAMRIEGTIAPGRADGNCEYCVVVQISNQHGEKIARQVVGVGALQPGERHSYSFSVDLIPVRPDADRKKPDQ
ncbi:MAG TPA: hypothetical protein VMV25_04040 [Steroidobacteraceae bacterium]|nr:hypothetical protein [Steroidobacteraceae bacterium]